MAMARAARYRGANGCVKYRHDGHARPDTLPREPRERSQMHSDDRSIARSAEASAHPFGSSCGRTAATLPQKKWIRARRRSVPVHESPCLDVRMHRAASTATKPSDTLARESQDFTLGDRSVRNDIAHCMYFCLHTEISTDYNYCTVTDLSTSTKSAMNF